MVELPFSGLRFIRRRKAAADARIALFSAVDGADQLAQPLLEHRQGALTWALLQGMQGAAEIRRQDRQINLYELRNYVQHSVPTKANGRQRPEVHLGQAMKDFVISRIPAGT